MDKLGPYILGPTEDEHQGIYTGDARELAPAIPDESVDLIFTDPVYQNIDDYRWLAETAARVLKDGGSVIAQTHNLFRYDAETAMRTSELVPLPLLAEIFDFAKGYLYKYSLSIGMKPYIWMCKGPKRNGRTTFDRVYAGRISKRHHRWGDSPDFFIIHIRALTDRAEAILDPFTGGGTIPAVCKMLGRRWLAFEINPDVAETARQRVRQTQPPLFVPQPQQLSLMVEA